MYRLVVGYGCAVVRHGTFVGLRGPVRLVPDHLWQELASRERQLIRLLRDLPTPFEQRG
jgi:hypothetical protein